MPGALEESDDLGERAGADHPESLDLRRLSRVRGRHDDPRESAASRGDGHREDARRGHELALEGELAGERIAIERSAGYLCGGGEDPHGHRKIQARPLLAKVARREVDGDPAQWPLQARTLDRRPDAVARVPDGGARQPRERERRQPSPHVRFDRHQMTADTQDGNAQHPSVHGRHRMPLPPAAP